MKKLSTIEKIIFLIIAIPLYLIYLTISLAKDMK